MNEITKIVNNPLQGIVCPSPRRKKVARPRWMCKHAEAVLVDRENCVYKCFECNPTRGTITVVPNVSTKARSPKPVTVSPSHGDESPKGFT